MLVYRLTRKKYKDDISGNGSMKFGGRWNSEGVRLLYTSNNRALAMAEVAVHFSLATLPEDFFMLEIFIPDSEEKIEVMESSLPYGWNDFPAADSVQHFGDAFINEGKYLLCKVPSAVVKGEWNILLNPKHKGFKKVKIKHADPFLFDRRLFE